MGALRVRGGAPPALPDDVWRVIVLERTDGIRARRLAGVSRMFNELAVEHEDNRVPDSTAATEPYDPEATWEYGAYPWASEPDEPEDYRCCECGFWVPEWERLEGLLDPWGYALTLSTVRGARAYLAADASEPGDAATRQNMQAAVAAWPGRSAGNAGTSGRAEVLCECGPAFGATRSRPAE